MLNVIMLCAFVCRFAENLLLTTYISGVKCMVWSLALRARDVYIYTQMQCNMHVCLVLKSTKWNPIRCFFASLCILLRILLLFLVICRFLHSKFLIVKVFCTLAHTQICSKNYRTCACARMTGESKKKECWKFTEYYSACYWKLWIRRKQTPFAPKPKPKPKS